MYWPWQGMDHSLSHAYAEYGYLSAKVLDGVIADTRIFFGVSWTWADYELGRVLGNQLIQGNLVVAVYRHHGALEDEILVHIPGERIVVINENDI